MAGLKTAFLTVAGRIVGGAAREKALEAAVHAFLRGNGVEVGSLSCVAGEEPRLLFFGDAKIEGRTLTVMVSADPKHGVIDGALVQLMTAAQFRLMRYEWEFSIASCIRFYDFLLDRLSVHAPLRALATSRA